MHVSALDGDFPFLLPLVLQNCSAQPNKLNRSEQYNISYHYSHTERAKHTGPMLTRLIPEYVHVVPPAGLPWNGNAECCFLGT